MFEVLQILTLVTVALAMALSVAHALEMPGKMRLSQGEYMAVQHIYYPGFTIGGGIGEAGGILLTLILLLLTPARTPAFWLTLVALILLMGMQAVYWLSTHPVNRYWLEDQDLSTAGSLFFSFQAHKHSPPESGSENWKRLRNRWEYSHVVRAGLAVLSFLSLLVAMTTNR